MSIRTETADAICTITLDRPEKLNAFAGTMREDLLSSLRRCDEDASVRAVLITGAGRAFSAGGDVEFMASLRRNNDEESLKRLLDAGAAVVTCITMMSKPVIAVVNGVAAGAGCNLALACDYRIASENAKFSQAFVRIGLHPDWGGTWLLPRLVGKSRAFEIMATGRMIDSAEALRIGMIDRVVPAGDLMQTALDFAQALAAVSPLSLSGIKAALRDAGANELEEQLALEKSNQERCFRSEDALEGMNAFAEKRAPLFRGR
jgi:2-(1,2-epoxy-1,2-dihydrophenyl)acetyl-CoA isomerase